MKQVLITIILLGSISLQSQVCFTYDNAGNRIKRNSCALAISTQEMEQLSQLYPDLVSELRTSTEDNALSKLVVYPNPTAASFQIKDQHEWYGASMNVISNDGKILDTFAIKDSPLDLIHLPEGTYFLIMTKGKSRKTAKLFITK